MWTLAFAQNPQSKNVIIFKVKFQTKYIKKVTSMLGPKDKFLKSFMH